MSINLRWVVRHLPFWLLLAVVVTAVLGSFEGIINGLVLGRFPTLVGATSTRLFQYLGAAALLYVGTYTFLYLSQVLIVVATKHLNVALKQTLLTVSFQQGEKPSSGLNHLTNDAAKIEQNYFSALASLLTAIATTVLSTVFVLTVNLVMGLVFIAFSALTMVPMIFGQKGIGRLGALWSQANDRTVQTASDWLTGRRELHQYAVEQPFFRRVSAALTRSENALQKQNIRQWTVQYSSWLLVVLTLVGPWAVGFYLMSHGGFGITISVLLTLTLTADHVVGGVRQVMGVWGQLASTAALRRLPAAPQPFTAPTSTPAATPALHLDSVALNYGDHAVLAPTTLTVPYGTKMLLTGPSGIGKTSCLNLLAGWQKPTRGTVALADAPVDPTQVTYIPQDPWLFTGTVRDNLTLTAAYPDQTLRAALTAVGLNAELGPDPLAREIHPDADDLSGGQKQRLVIARALLRQRPVILLDEITAGLDDRNAHAIRTLIYRLPQTVIESAHHTDPALAHEFHFQTYALQNQQLVPAPNF